MIDDYPRNDVGNGMRFARDHHHRARWCSDLQEWFIWDGHRWCRHAKDDRALALAKTTAVEILRSATEEADDGRRDALVKWGARSHSAAGLSNMVRMAKSDPGMWSSVGEFDQHPYLLNFTNGTVDLRSGELRAHDSADRISQLVPYDYDPSAVAPLWQGIVDRCFAVDQTGETAAFVQVALGYMLIGSNPAQLLFLVVGPKRTGKSKLLEIVARLLGTDYGRVAQAKLVLRSRWGTHHDSETYSLLGKRFVAISETDAAMNLDETMVKTLTGSSVMSVRRLHRAQEEQVPATWTIVIGTNEEPTIERWDDAIGRRVIKIQSGPSLAPNEADLDLETKILTGEAQGVLAWLVAGAVEWHRRRGTDGGHGFRLPEAVASATRGFEVHNDHVADFLASCVEVGEGYTAKPSDVERAYKEHRGRPENALAKRALYSRIMEYYEAREQPVTKDARWFYGIRLGAPIDQQWAETWTSR